GASQPRAPTERNVTVSRHSALLTHPSEIGRPGPMCKQVGRSSNEVPPPPPGFLERPEPLELSTSPAHQVGVDADEKTTHFLPVERAVVFHPSSDDRVHPLGQFCQVACCP